MCYVICDALALGDFPCDREELLHMLQVDSSLSNGGTKEETSPEEDTVEEMERSALWRVVQMRREEVDLVCVDSGVQTTDANDGNTREFNPCLVLLCRKMPGYHWGATVELVCAEENTASCQGSNVRRELWQIENAFVHRMETERLLPFTSLEQRMEEYRKVRYPPQLHG